MVEGKQKPVWQIIVESVGGAAFITVLFGGILGAYITGMIQKNQKEQTYLNELNKARISEKIKIVREAIQLVGKIVSATTNVLASQKWDLNAYNDHDQKTLKKQQSEIIDKYNVINEEWERDRFVFGFLLSYYHENRPEVKSAWKELQNMIDTYKDCANYLAVTGLEKDPCGSPSEVESSLQDLLTKLYFDNDLK